MKLNEQTKEEIRKTISVWEGPLRAGADPLHILDQIATYAIGLLQVDPKETAEWYEADAEERK